MVRDKGSVQTGRDVVFSFNPCLDAGFDRKCRSNFVLQEKPIVATAADPRTAPFHSFPTAIANVFIASGLTYEGISKNEEAFRQATGVRQPQPKFLRVIRLHLRSSKNP